MRNCVVAATDSTIAHDAASRIWKGVTIAQFNRFTRHQYSYQVCRCLVLAMAKMSVCLSVFRRQLGYVKTNKGRPTPMLSPTKKCSPWTPDSVDIRIVRISLGISPEEASADSWAITNSNVSMHLVAIIFRTYRIGQT